MELEVHWAGLWPARVGTLRQDAAGTVFFASGLTHTPLRNGLDYGDLMDLARTLTQSHSAVVQLYRRALFNVLAANDDDHGRNHAFLMDEAGGWSLAPAFDVTLATYPLASGFRAASVNGRAAGITRRDLLELGLSQDIASPRDILGEVAAAIADWPAHAAANGLSATQAHLVATEHRPLE